MFNTPMFKVGLSLLISLFALAPAANAQSYPYHSEPEVIIATDAKGTDDILNRKNNIVFINDQLGYVFYTDKNNHVAFKKTIDGGATWPTKGLI